MIRLGEIQELVVTRKTDFGVYMAHESDLEDGILLPRKEVPDGVENGDSISVFVYKDSEDRFICTTVEPMITVGQIRLLKVVQVTKIGAFLSWGLLKDLFLPFKEQVGHVKEGQEVLVGLYVDKSERLCATMRLNKLLKVEAPQEVGDRVVGTIFSINPDYGVFIAVDDLYQALLPQKEVVKTYQIGDKITAKVTSKTQDGKLTLTLKEDGFTQMEADEEKLYQCLVEAGGFLPLTDKSDKEVINREVDLSKRAFKRSVGRLMKAGKITLTDKGIQIRL